MPELYAGVDGGKSEHHCHVLTVDGTTVLSRRVANDEAPLLELLGEVNERADGGPVTWAIDLNAGGAALLITILFNHGQRVLYLPGRTVYHAASTYRGSGKTDAKDAAIIADQARMRHDLQPLTPSDEISTDLRILTSHRGDLSADRTRQINRLRAQLLEYFPALERAFDYNTSKAALVLLASYQTPTALRRTGQKRLETWLKKRHVRGAAMVAATAVNAAKAQYTTLPGETVAADMVARLAKEVQSLDRDIADTDARIEERFRRHEHAEVITSMPGIGTLLGAEFLALTGGDMAAFGTPDRLAGVAGLAPVPRDSGRVRGNLHRPQRYNRRLLRVFYLSAQVSIRSCAESRAYYDRKRAEGKRHVQAVLALARRRLNVLWAMLRDGTPYQAPVVSTAA